MLSKPWRCGVCLEYRLQVLFGELFETYGKDALAGIRLGLRPWRFVGSTSLDALNALQIVAADLQHPENSGITECVMGRTLLPQGITTKQVLSCLQYPYNLQEAKAHQIYAAVDGDLL